MPAAITVAVLAATARNLHGVSSQAGSRRLLRGRAPTVYPPAMMGRLMMLAAVVKASQPGVAGKGLG